MDLNTNTQNIKDFLGSKKFLFAAAVGSVLILIITLIISFNASPKSSKGNVLLKKFSVTSVSPADNSTDVGIFQEIRVDFGLEVTEKEQDLTYISLSPDVEGEQVWTSDNKALIFKPTSPLLAERTYTATVFLGESEYSWTFNTTSTDNVNPEDEMRAQEVADKNYIKEEARIESNYPWLEKLPLEAASYFVYFDIEKEAFVGQLYPKQSSQTEPMKAEVMTRLQELGIPTENYPFEWEVNPE